MQDMDQHRHGPSEGRRDPDTKGPSGRSGGRAEGPQSPRHEDRTFDQRTDVGPGDRLEHPLIPARRVNGSPVYNQAGEEIGKVEDLAIDKRSGKVAYAILSFGGFMGLGEKHQPLPWSALTFDTDRGGYVVDVTEEFLRLAPKLDTTDLSGWDDTNQRVDIHAYYGPLGARPYW